MAIKDLLQRFIFENAPVRGEYVHLHESFQTIMSQHQYPEPIRRILGEALTVASLLSAIIKFNGRLTVQFQGKGGLKLLLAQCDNNFQIRGLAKWEGSLTYEEIMDSFKDGVLVIMLDSGGAKGRYQGIVSWRGNSLAESIEGYFRDSEQLSTRLWLTVGKTSASGFLLQIIPENAKTEVVSDQDITNPHWDRIVQLTEQLSQDDLIHLEYEQLLAKLYPDEAIRLFTDKAIEFRCTCSRKRSADAIMILGREEAEAELSTNHSLVVTCDFCNKEYVFDKADIRKIFEAPHGPESNTLH